MGEVKPLKDTGLKSVPVFQRVDIQGHDQVAAPLTSDQGEQRRMITMTSIMNAIDGEVSSRSALLCCSLHLHCSPTHPMPQGREAPAGRWLLPYVASRERSWTACMTTPRALRLLTSAPSSATTTLSCGVRRPSKVKHDPPSPQPWPDRAAAIPLPQCTTSP